MIGDLPRQHQPVWSACRGSTAANPPGKHANLRASGERKRRQTPHEARRLRLRAARHRRARRCGCSPARPDAKVLAGGQTLGPMLNLRLAQPALLVDITRIPELAAVSEDADAVTIGATVTHAAIEDGRVPDPTGGFLARVARGIAYRAVRTRGTIGGSLAHADPAADWLSCLAALGAEVVIAGAGRQRGASRWRASCAAPWRRSWPTTSCSPPCASRGSRARRASASTRSAARPASSPTPSALPPTTRTARLTRLVASTAAGAPDRRRGRGRSIARRLPEVADLQRRLVQAGLDRRRLRPQAARHRRAPRHPPGAGRMTRIALTVNGKPVAAEVAPRTHLADFLREQLLLTGTHIGCEHGICGACTVEIDGEIARSCITYAVGLRRRRACAPSRASTTIP